MWCSCPIRSRSSCPAFKATRPPGKRYDYSNLGAGLLGHLLCRATGRSLDDLMVERICRPLGLDSTRIVATDRMRQRLVTGHEAGVGPVPLWRYGVLAGCAALLSDAADLVRYLEAQLVPGDDPVGRAIRVTQAERFVVQQGVLAMGLGWHLTGQGDNRDWVHAGGTYGCTSYVAFNPVRRVGLVLLTNSGIHGWIPAAGSQLFEYLCGRPYRIPQLPRSTTVAAEELRRFEGRYRYVHDRSTVRATVEQDHLRLRSEGEPDQGVAAFPLGAGRFIAKSAAVAFKFDLDPATGRVRSFAQHEGPEPLKAVRID
ncbi:MAG: beta-lactamase family protein [Candidatus Riflebacteria bacterium]|nr:beta-lactamase family protein [Candidatus Riflebacteria bacterium]